MSNILQYLFKKDLAHNQGVARINTYLLRLIFTLVFVFVTYESWAHIFNHRGPWQNAEAAAWCMWGSYSAISVIGIIRPLKMLPLMLFIILYKVAWLLVVAYPLWLRNELAGSPAQGMAMVFIWVVLPILAMPWRYFFITYIAGQSKRKQVYA